jgi:heptosyltransferase I
VLIRPSALGDVCRTVPLVARLRAGFPGAEIWWVVQDGFAGAVAGHPGLSPGGVIRFARAKFGRLLDGDGLAGLLGWIDGLNDLRADVVVDAQGLLRSGVFTLLSGAPMRIGHADAAEAAWLGYSHRVRAPRRSMHTVDRMLALLGPLGLPTGPASTAEMRLTVPGEVAEGRLPGGLERAQRIVVMAPTTRWPAKKWPDARFAAVADALLAAGAADRVALVGAASERGQCGAVLRLAEREPKVVDLLGRTDLPTLLGLMDSAALVLGCDSAAAHMAVGLGRPLVALYGPTDVRRVGPYRREADVLQVVGPGDRLDHKRAEQVTLMERISVEQVLEACHVRLAGAASGLRG